MIMLFNTCASVVGLLTYTLYSLGGQAMLSDIIWPTVEKRVYQNEAKETLSSNASH